MMRATSSGIPPGFTGLEDTSFFGDTCICTSLMVLPFVSVTSTRTKSASTVAFPKNGPVGTKKKEKENGIRIAHVSLRLLLKFRIQSLLEYQVWKKEKRKRKNNSFVPSVPCFTLSSLLMH